MRHECKTWHSSLQHLKLGTNKFTCGTSVGDSLERSWIVSSGRSSTDITNLICSAEDYRKHTNGLLDNKYLPLALCSLESMDGIWFSDSSLVWQNWERNCPEIWQHLIYWKFWKQNTVIRLSIWNISWMRDRPSEEEMVKNGLCYAILDSKAL